MNLKDKIIIVTGGAGLLGRVFCETIVQNNGVAIIADVNKNKGKELERELQDKLKSKDAYFCELDITSIDSIKFLQKSIENRFGHIDALINNAYPKNKNYGRHFFDVEYNDFCVNVNMHLGGYFLMCQQFSKYFVEQGYGNIINIASIYGVIAPRFEIYENTKMTMPVEYAVIKSAIIHLTKYIAKYLKNSGVRINTLSPGGILDNQPESFLNAYKGFSLSKGMLLKDDIVGTLLFLLSDSSKFINGQNIVVDDGFSL